MKMATIELSDGKEEEIGEDDCGEAVRSLVAPVFNMIENCLLLSNMVLGDDQRHRCVWMHDTLSRMD